MSGNNVTAGQTISATIRYSNKDASARVYDIEADVNISEDKVSNFNNGTVRDKGSDTMVTLCNFSGMPTSYFSLGFSEVDKEKAQKILEAIYSFIGDVEASVNIAE